MKEVVLLKSGGGHEGGLEKHAARIRNAFIERGDRVTLLATGGHIRWPSFVRMEQFDRFVQRWLEKNRVDLVFGMDRNRRQTHLRAGNGVHAAYLKQRSLCEPLAKRLLFRFNPLHRKILELEKEGFESPLLQKIFANSEMVRREILHSYKVDPAKIEVIHNGVEWEEMGGAFSDWEEGKKRALEMLDLRADSFHLLFIGNGYRRKGLGPLLIALSQMNGVHLSVIGKESKIDSYRRQVVELGLKDRVHFWGPTANIRPFYQLADALVIPSFYDPFANVTVEALAMGLFVISSKHNGGHEVLTPQNGVVIEDLLSTEAMIEALRKGLAQRKTKKSASAIRGSVKHLDFSNQLRLLMGHCE